MIKAIVLMVLTVLVCSAQPEIEWARCYGGSGSEEARQIIETDDKAFIIVGSTSSSDGDVSVNKGGYDFWVIKIDSSGSMIWEKTYGGSSNDHAYSIGKSPSGQIYIAGYTESNDGDVASNWGLSDYWVIRIDSLGGLLWEKNLGGENCEYSHTLSVTSDYEIFIGGRTESNNRDVTGWNGGRDYWIAKLDSTGDLVSEDCFGGTGDEYCWGSAAHAEGAIYFCGSSYSNNIDVSGNHGEGDFWLVKISRWIGLSGRGCFGGSSIDEAYSIDCNSLGGIVVGGMTRSNDGDVSGNHGNTDMWVVNIDESFDMIWQKCLGGSSHECAWSIIENDLGHFIVAGNTLSNDGDVSEYLGGYDIWIVELNDSGEIRWDKTIGGSGSESAYSMIQTSDGGYILAGYTYSSDYDVHGNRGGSDYWVVKLAAYELDVSERENVPQTPRIQCFPSPFNSSISIDLPKNAYQVKIVDISGRVVFESDALEERNQISWRPHGHIESGIYIVNAISDVETMTQRIVYLK